MRVAVRADSCEKIGTGHVMRCMALADALRARGAHVTFSCRPLPGDRIADIRDANFDVHDASDQMIPQVDWLVVDRYDLGEQYESSMRRFAARILAIDDLANRKHDCDLLLDQNLAANMDARYEGLLPDGAKALLGPRFALLRPEFALARVRVKRVDRAKRIFVFFGGSDATNETTKTLRALDTLEHVDFSVDVLIGASNVHRDDVEALARKMPRVQTLPATRRISELMLSADLAIGGGGSTTWERCCLGLPTLAVAVADNQVELSQALADASCQRYLGRFDHVSEGAIAEAVEQCLAHFPECLTMGMKGMRLVDGLGTQRVIEAMENA